MTPRCTCFHLNPTWLFMNARGHFMHRTDLDPTPHILKVFLFFMLEFICVFFCTLSANNDLSLILLQFLYKNFIVGEEKKKEKEEKKGWDEGQEANSVKLFSFVQMSSALWMHKHYASDVHNIISYLLLAYKTPFSPFPG